MATILKYNKNKNQFNLNLSGKHFIYRKTRQEEIEEIDDWLINNEPYENKAYITFEDEKGKVHKHVPVHTSKMYCWFNNHSVMYWEIPTNEGTIYINPNSNMVMLGDSYKYAIKVRPNRVSINY